MAERPLRRAAATHLRVFLIAGLFGLAAYAVVRGLIYVSDRAGLLDWLRG
jgi:hypothetical protein